MPPQSSNFRQRIQVRLADGRSYKIVTSARDVAKAQVVTDPEQLGEAWFMFRLMHQASMRLGVDVPSDFDEFVDDLDGFDQLDGIPTSTPAGMPAAPQDAPAEQEAELPDPTRLVASGTSPSG